MRKLSGCWSGRLDRIVKQTEKLAGVKRSYGVGLPFVVAELDVEEPVLQDFHNCSDLAFVESWIQDVLYYGNHIQNFETLVHVLLPASVV